MVIGPLTDMSVIDNIVELFSDIPNLGTIVALDGAAGMPGEGLRAFTVVTTSPEDELRDLFSFHVSREQVQFLALATPAAAAASDRVSGELSRACAQSRCASPPTPPQ